VSRFLDHFAARTEAGRRKVEFIYYRFSLSRKRRLIRIERL
jgi:hypothetical protein